MAYSSKGYTDISYLILSGDLNIHVPQSIVQLDQNQLINQLIAKYIVNDGMCIKNKLKKIEHAIAAEKLTYK